jgi:hypothetical protein
VKSISGVGPLPPWRQLAVLGGAERGRAVELARAVGATRVVVRARSPLASAFAGAGWTSVGALDGLTVLASPSRPQHAFLAAEARIVDATESIGAARRGAPFDAQEIFVEGTTGAREEGDVHGRFQVLERRQHAYRWRVAVEQPTWLAVREPYYPNWKATIDDHGAEIRPAGGFFLAVRVPAGEHEVGLRYEEPGVLPGAIAAALAACGLGLVGMRRAVSR